MAQSGDLFKDKSNMPGPTEFPSNVQNRPEGVGLQQEMLAKPITTQIANETSFEEGYPTLADYKGSAKLQGRKALITGGDSGIGRSVAVLFAKEGADIAINFLPVEQKDAEETQRLVKHESRQCHLIPLDLKTEENCKSIVDTAVNQLGGIDLLVSNAAYQMVQESVEFLTEEQVDRTFRTNVYPAIFLSKHALPHLRKGSSIIITTSVVAYQGNHKLIDYASTKAALVGLIRSLAAQLAPKGIRVNGVAPGPVWTPLQPISRSEEDLKEFGKKKPPLGRIAQPSEIAPSYVFLASGEASQYTGQVLHPNGGYIING
jgi:NAD(P)-dependent dehydrogenase (short-subunit alcohol dehydrogenase family)